MDEAVHFLSGNRVDTRIYGTKLGNSNASLVWELIRLHDWRAGLSAEEVAAKAFALVELLEKGCAERSWYVPFPSYEKALREAVQNEVKLGETLRNAQPIRAGFAGGQQ